MRLLPLIILSLCWYSDSYARDIESSSENFDEKSSADNLVNAIALYSLEIQFSTNFPLPDPFIELGNCYAQLGHMELALVNYEKAIEVARYLYGNEKDKRFCDLYFNCAKAYEDRHMHKEAVTLYEKTIELDPQFPNAKNRCAWILATSHDPAVRDGARALELARLECFHSGWNNPSHLDTYAAAQAASGNFAEAIKWQLKAINLEKDKAALEILRQHLRFHQGRGALVNSITKPNPVFAKDARVTREIEVFVSQYIEQSAFHMMHPDYLEASKRRYLRAALRGIEGGGARNQVELQKLLLDFKVRTITELKSLTRMQFANAVGRDQYGAYDPIGGKGRPLYVPWWYTTFKIDNIFLTKEGGITIAILKLIISPGDRELVKYYVLFLNESEGVLKVLTELEASEILPVFLGVNLWVLEKSGRKVRKEKWEKYQNAIIQPVVSKKEKLGNHLEETSKLNRLGMSYLYQQDYAKAEPILKQLLAVLEKVYGPDHFLTAHGLNNLSHLYQAQGDTVRAKELKRRANQVFEKNLRNFNPTMRLGD